MVRHLTNLGAWFKSWLKATPKYGAELVILTLAVLATLLFFYFLVEMFTAWSILKAETEPVAQVEAYTPPDPCGLEAVECPGETKIEPKRTEPAKVSPPVAMSTATLANVNSMSTKASWYDYKYQGEWVTKHRLVAASNQHPKGSMLLVTNPANGKSVTVKITDYGPNLKVHPDRQVDLGSLAFSQIADLRSGVIQVEVTLLSAS